MDFKPHFTPLKPCSLKLGGYVSSTIDLFDVVSVRSLKSWFLEVISAQDTSVSRYFVCDIYYKQ